MPSRSRSRVKAVPVVMVALVAKAATRERPVSRVD
jgi:hypothetical protein